MMDNCSFFNRVNVHLSTIEITKDSENKLLSRREVVLNFKGGSGFITRPAAVEAISTRLGVSKDKVRIISLEGKFGSRDLVANAYVYTDASQIKRQLPAYLAIRELPKEERKKAREALKPKPATPAEAAKKS
jgi:ribosomal protein S24E